MPTKALHICTGHLYTHKLKKLLERVFVTKHNHLEKTYVHTTNQLIISHVGIITGAKAKHFAMKAVSHVSGAIRGSKAS